MTIVPQIEVSWRLHDGDRVESRLAVQGLNLRFRGGSPSHDFPSAIDASRGNMVADKVSIRWA